MRLIDVDALIDDFKNELEKVDFDNLSENDTLIIKTSAKALIDFAKRQPIIQHQCNCNKWHVVADGDLPPFGIPFLCCDKHGSFHVSGITWISDGSIYFGSKKNVVAWMPLPEPYKEGEKNE